MAFDPDAFLAQTAQPAGSGFDPDKFLSETEPDSKSLGGFAKNALQDVGGIAKGVVDFSGQLTKGALDLASGQGSDLPETLMNVPRGIVQEGKRLGIGTLLTEGPVAAAKQFGEAAYDKPVSTALDVLPIVTGAVKGINAIRGGAEAGALGTEAGELAKLADTPIAAETAPKLAEAAAPKLEAPAAPASIPFAAEAKQALDKANDVKNYISRGYEGFAKKPGVTADIADWMQEKSQMMAAQQMGATPLQARQIGHEGMRAIGQYAMDNGITDVTNGLKGMRAKQIALNNAAGETIGALRKEADLARDQMTTPVDVLQAVHQKFDPIFSRGTRSGEAGSYAKAIEEIEDSKPTFTGVSEIATKLNKAANAAQRVNQPHGAFTDVANFVSEINNERIKAVLGPEKAARYEQALRDFGATKKIGEFLKRKEAGEVKRFGPGSVTSNLTQKAMDEIGYKLGAKVANKVSTSILKNPSIAKSLPALFKEFINQVEDIGHDVTGMSEGGMVTPDMAEFVSRTRRTN